MKKVLFTVAALGLVAGLATSASALELKVTGDYTVDGFYIDKGWTAASSNGEGSYGVSMADNYTLPYRMDDEITSDAWLQHMFNMNAEMIVNDKISMKSRIRLVDWGTVWGEQEGGSADVNNGKNMSVERLWMVYKSPVGTWEIGRRPAGAWGLSFLDSETNGDRIFWSSGKMFGDTFSAYAFFQKMYEGDALSWLNDGRKIIEMDGTEADSDYYELAGTMKGGWGMATLAYGLLLKNESNWPNDHAYYRFYGDEIDFTVPPGTTNTYGTTVSRIKGVGQFKFGGNMGLDTEFDYKFGEKDFNNVLIADKDIDQLAFIADFNATFDALTGHAMYFYTSGDADGSTGDLESYGGPGGDFEPLYVLTGVFCNLLNNDQGTTNHWGAAAKTAGTNAFVLSTDYAASQDLTLHAAFGYAVAADEMNGWDDEYGFEYNIGAAYKLVDNLIYAVHLGYLDSGDFFKLGNRYQDTNSIFLASHHLTMSF